MQEEYIRMETKFYLNIIFLVLLVFNIDSSTFIPTDKCWCELSKSYYMSEKFLKILEATGLSDLSRCFPVLFFNQSDFSSKARNEQRA